MAAVYKKGRTSQVQSLFLYFSINAPVLEGRRRRFSTIVSVYFLGMVHENVMIDERMR
jgi:hypothetical protein